MDLFIVTVRVAQKDGHGSVHEMFVKACSLESAKHGASAFVEFLYSNEEGLVVEVLSARLFDLTDNPDGISISRSIFF